LGYSFKTYLPFYKRNLALAVPIMVSQLGQTVTNLVDSVMVGHLGTREFAGVSFAIFVYLIPFVFAISFSCGTVPFLASSIGSGNRKECARYFMGGFILNAVVSVLLFLICLAIIPFMDYMGQDPEILPYSKEYFAIIAFSLIPTIVFFYLKNFSEALGNTRIPMYVTIGLNVVNVFLNWIMIFGNCGCPALGVTGAAISTVISRFVGIAALVIIYLHRFEYKQVLKFIIPALWRRETSAGECRDSEREFIRFSWIDNFKVIRRTFSMSLPIGFQGMMEGTIFSVGAIMSGWFGQYAIAAHNIADQLSTSTFMIAQGIGQATTIRVSTQLGAGNYDDTKRAGRAAMHLAIFFMSCCAIVFVSFSRSIPFLFLYNHMVARIARPLIFIVAAYQIFDAIQLTGLSALRGLKDVKIPLLFSLISYYGICFPCAYIIGVVMNIGPKGIWLGFLCGLFTAGLLFQLRFNKLANRIIETGKPLH